jgi:hypothetical protein
MSHFAEREEIVLVCGTLCRKPTQFPFPPRPRLGGAGG